MQDARQRWPHRIGRRKTHPYGRDRRKPGGVDVTADYGTSTLRGIFDLVGIDVNHRDAIRQYLSHDYLGAIREWIVPFGQPGQFLHYRGTSLLNFSECLSFCESLT